MTSSATAFAILLVGCLGAGLGFWLARSRAAVLNRAEHAEWQVERSRLESATARLEGEFQAQGRSLRQAQNELTEQRRLNRDLDAIISPVRSGLDTLVNRVGSAERARVEAQTEITQQLGHMAQQFGQATLDVRNEARRLSRVLSRSERRGAWGEMQLRTLVESSGMLKHVHFEEQDHSRGEGGVLRPDLVVHLSEGRHAVVDAKVPLDAFLQMGDEDDDSHTLARHADSVAAHIGKLAAKEYWRRYNSPEFVIMFLPAEGLLSAALSVRPELLQSSMDKKVFLATPSTLMAMLHAVSLGWRQAEAAGQARDIQEAGAELYRRVLRMAESVQVVGKAIAKTAAGYNQLVATMETRVVPAGRKVESLAIADAEFPSLDPLDAGIRPMDAAKWPHLSDAEALAAHDTPQDPQGGTQSSGTGKRTA